jgi:probable rRNA maturation factor
MVISMGNNIEFIDLMNNEILKDYEKVFGKILKRIKRKLKIHGKIGMSITLCDNAYIKELNKNYRNKDVPTDVLSFAIEDDENEEFLKTMIKLSSIREIGDIIISYEKAQEQAKEYGHSLKREMCFLFTHGVLHLLGYDHINKTDEDVMFGLQKAILSEMKIDR